MSNNEWKPFVFFDSYVKSTPDSFSCDYREVTHKIPEYHTMIDPRTNKERKGIFIPAGDIQVECWFNPVDPTSPHYQEWHTDNMRVIIKEVDSYNRSYCDNQKKKNYEEKKPNREIYTGFELTKEEKQAKKQSGFSSPRRDNTSTTGGSFSPEAPTTERTSNLSTTAATTNDDMVDDDIPF